MRYSLEQLQALAAATGFPDPALAAAVAMAESHIPETDLADSCAQGDPNIGVHSCDGPNGTSKSFGLWQIHVGFNPQYDPKSLLDPQYNARAALAISRGGTKWSPWSAFKNGKYLKWYQNVVYPPHGGPPIIPQPVTPPETKQSGLTIAAVTLGVGAFVAAAGYGAYRMLASRPAPRPLPSPEPEPVYYVPPPPSPVYRRFP